MNSRRLRTWIYLGALLLPAMVLSASTLQKSTSAPSEPVVLPSSDSPLRADGGAPPPTLPVKKPGTSVA